MNAIVKTERAAGAVMKDIPSRGLQRAAEILVRPIMTSICGTDYHVYSWDAWAAGRVTPPRVMGHEYIARVVEVGSETSGFQIGDLVSGESHIVCGTCLQCRTGQGHVCAATRILGVDTDGCFCEEFAIPQASVWKCPPSISPEIACILDPLGNAVHTVLAGEVAGRRVLVLGCGPIGAMAVAVARACGASTIIATDTRPYRLDLARRLGADLTIDIREQDVQSTVQHVSPGGVDVSLEMSGAPSALTAALRSTRPGGRVSLLGLPSGDVTIALSEDVVLRGLTLQGIVGRRLYETWATMGELLSSGRLDVRPIITHEMPWTDFADAMALMRDGTCGKVVLHMG